MSNTTILDKNYFEMIFYVGLKKYGISENVFRYKEEIQTFKDILLIERIGNRLTSGQENFLLELRKRSAQYKKKAQNDTKINSLKKIDAEYNINTVSFGAPSNEEVQIQKQRNDNQYYLIAPSQYIYRTSKKLLRIQFDTIPSPTISLKAQNLKHSFSLISHYFVLLLIILFPFMLGMSILLFYGSPLKGSLHVLIPLFVISLGYCAFKGPLYYYDVIQKLRYCDIFVAYFSKRVRKIFSTLSKIFKNIAISGIIMLYTILYGVYLFLSVPDIYIILVIILVLVYYEFFLTKHVVRKEISTNPQIIFTAVSFLGIFGSSLILLSIEKMELMLFILPGLMLISWLVCKYRLLEWCGRVILYSKMIFVLIADKIGLITLYKKAEIVIERIKRSKRTLVLICVCLIACTFYLNDIDYVVQEYLLNFVLFFTIAGFLALICLTTRIIRSIRGGYSYYYHKYKVALLLVALIIASFIYIHYFCFSPQKLIIGALIIIVFTLPFTKKDKNKHNSKDKHLRKATLLSIFLVFMPLMFSVNSLLIINPPDYEFAHVPNDDKIENSVDLDMLKYYSSLEDIEGFTINDKFVVRSIISPSFGIASKVRVRLVPINVTPVEGYHLTSGKDICVRSF